MLVNAFLLWFRIIRANREDGINAFERCAVDGEHNIVGVVPAYANNQRHPLVDNADREFNKRFFLVFCDCGRLARGTENHEKINASVDDMIYNPFICFKINGSEAGEELSKVDTEGSQKVVTEGSVTEWLQRGVPRLSSDRHA